MHTDIYELFSIYLGVSIYVSERLNLITFMCFGIFDLLQPLLPAVFQYGRQQAHDTISCGWKRDLTYLRVICLLQALLNSGEV